MDFVDLDFLVGNMLTIEGKMNALCIAERCGTFVPDWLVVEVLGGEDYTSGPRNRDMKTYRIASEYIDERKLDYLESLLKTEDLSRESLARAFVRKNDFRSAARVFQLGRNLAAEGIAFEKDGDMFLAMARYEQAGEFGDAKIVSGMLSGDSSRTRAYGMLESYGMYEPPRH